MLVYVCVCVCVCLCVCEQDNCTHFKYYIVYAYSLWLKEYGDIFLSVALNADRGYGIMPMTLSEVCALLTGSPVLLASASCLCRTLTPTSQFCRGICTTVRECVIAFV